MKRILKFLAIKTGIKAYMQDDEVLYLYNRSSNPKKKGLILANSVGVIDKDYYGNPDNDGHIMFAFYNIKDEDIEIKNGEAIGQAVFQKYLVVDDDNAEVYYSEMFGVIKGLNVNTSQGKYIWYCDSSSASRRLHS